ncbi:hypothetical protein PsorP6_010530 [Peronosclerospora sorghi]|uniref:Uncharacterized protein n=1 Tax=Peronosclerospora sorghi TaxID=230839 RepID=A0ACC0VWR4_9STRA|nr:hypothetical protein PsorP6_010530 [Peronosclerospora sorghi]
MEEDSVVENTYDTSNQLDTASSPSSDSSDDVVTGEYYAVADLTETQRLLLGDFIDFGLLYRKRSNSDRFYTTSLAVNLIFGESMGQKRSHVRLTSSFASVRAGMKS